MTKNRSSISILLRQASIFIIVFYFCAVSVEAKNLDKNVVTDNENKAVELSKVWELDSIKLAVNLFKQTAEDWEKLSEPQRAAFCLNETAKLAQMYSDYEIAFRALNTAIKLETENNLFEEKIISSSLYSLFSIEKSDKKNAQKYSEQALFLSKKVSSAKAKAYSHFCKGMYEYYYGKMRDATDFFERANTYAQETQDIFILSQSLYYVGFSYLRNGSPYNAVDKMNLALQECEKYEYKKGIALSYFGIAFVNYYSNEKQKALDFLKKADSLFPVNFEWMEKARIVTITGLIFMEFGELEAAESNFQKAITYYEKVDYILGKIGTLTLLADTYLLKSNLNKAKQIYELGIELSLKIDDKFRLANVKEGLGNVEFRENNFDAAIKNYLEALQIYNNIGVKLPVIENLLGNAHKQKRDYQTARNYYSSALKTNRKTKDFLQLSETLFNFAKLNLIENNPDEAQSNIKESVELTENLYSNVANANLKSAYFSNVFERYELYINLLMKMQKQSPNENYAIQALQASEKSRARSLLESLRLSEANFTKDANPETVNHEKEIRNLLSAKADKLTEALSLNTDKEEIEKLSNEINELENELEQIKADLKQNSPLYSAIKNPTPFDVNDFQASVLDDKTLLLEFSFGADESYLWLIGKNEVSHSILPKREILELRIQKLLDLLKAREISEGEEPESYQKRLIDAEKEYESEARLLSNELFGQIADKLGDKRLIIVPDGKLSYFPVSALPLPNTDDNEPILLTNEVVYESSAATLQILGKTPHPDKPTAKELLVFADPIFSLQDNRLSAEDKNPTDENDSAAFLGSSLRSFDITDSTNQLKRLFATQEEADAIVKIVGASNATIASGFAANRQRVFEKDVSDYKIIHFATHGLMNDTRPELSGIVLSLFDQNGEAQKGFIRLQDIYSLNLSADLVVLSACQSGVGKEIKGEGLMSLTGGFIQSGANSVLSSLWKVDDYATAELMKNFYQELSTKNLAPSQALQTAQIKMRQNPNFKSPFYWAAFTVQGEFRHPIRVNEYRFSYLWIVLATIFVGLIIFFIRRFVKTR